MCGKYINFGMISHKIPLGYPFWGLLLSDRSEVRVLSGVPKVAAIHDFVGCGNFFVVFLPAVGSPKPGDFYALKVVCLLRRLERFSQIC